MENPGFIQNSIDADIINIISKTNEKSISELSCKVLLSNLGVLNSLNVKLSTSCNEKLGKFIQKYLSNIDCFLNLSRLDFREIQRLIILILSFQELPEKLNILKAGLTSELNNVEEHVSELSLKDEASKNVLSRHLKVLHIVMECIGKNNVNEVVTLEMKSRLRKLINFLLFDGEKPLLSDALSLLFLYLKMTEDWMVLEQALCKVTDKSISDRSSNNVFIMIVSFLVDSSLDTDKLTLITNTDTFWTAIKRSYTSGCCERKQVHHILKFSTLQLCRETVIGVWNEQHSKFYQVWWKKYFVISEILEEKQTHLVLPVFSLITDLLNDPVVRVDIFWIIILFQSALEHDSCTIRVKAILRFLDMKPELYEDFHFPLVLKLFLNAANDPALYRKLFKTSEFDAFEKTLIKWINYFVSSAKICFFESLFVLLCEVKWSPIPLYYILDFLTRTKIYSCLNIEVTKQLKETISNVIRSHNILIRAAIQCTTVKFVTMICKCTPTELPYFFDFVNFFNNEECLLRGVNSWWVLVDYLKSASDSVSLEKFISDKLTSIIDCDTRSSSRILLSLARDILLVHDSFGVLDVRNPFRTRIEYLISSFSSVLRSAYAPVRVQDNYLMLIAGIYDIVKNDDKTKNVKIPSPNIVVFIEENSTSILAYIIERMMKSQNNLELLDFYESCLQKYEKLTASFLKNSFSSSLLNEWWNKSMLNLQNGKEQAVYCYSKILLWIFRIVEAYPRSHGVKNVDFVFIVIKNFMNDKKIMTNITGALNVASNYANTMWSILKLSLKIDSSKFLKHCVAFDILTFILNSLDCVRKENLFLVFKTLKYVLSHEVVLKSEECVIQLMKDSWKQLEEIHSTPYYNDCLKYWIQAFLQKSVLRMQVYHIEIEQYVDTIVNNVEDNGGQSFRYAILVSNEFEKMDDLFEVLPQACDILMKIYCVTHIDRKDQRMESRTEDQIRSKGSELSVNQIKRFDVDYSSEVMRLKALNMILNLSKIRNGFTSVCLKFVKLLTTNDKCPRKGYFNDSLIHRVKHKKLQLLLIIETLAFHKFSHSNDSVELSNLLYDFAINCLLTEPHQPSVRYMLEWLLVRLILHYSSILCDKFWNSFSEASGERMGSICSFISVAFHVSNVSKNEKFVDQAVRFILPWAMGQHFNARLYAQTVLLKLINMSDSLKSKFEIVEESLNNSLKKGNAVKNSVKLQQDFYFSGFHSVNHFSLKMVLWDLPRLSGICCEEWLPKDLYAEYLHSDFDCGLPLYHEPDLFSSLTSSSWVAKATRTGSYKEHEFISDGKVSRVNALETQKKFVPVDTVSNASSSSFSKNTQQLIVVASLIDRAPNLGGLTRTCEIFAVSQLVVNNGDIVRSKEFYSLSITAEKHVNMIEVKRQNLYEYLRKLKEDEFFIVGAEQTANSKQLQQFVFPWKTAIVLGNEKEGIPASLLPVLDVCVEIPQSGVIRSLNVHVSASLLIWEYTKQHLFKSN